MYTRDAEPGDMLVFNFVDEVNSTTTKPRMIIAVFKPPYSQLYTLVELCDGKVTTLEGMQGH